PSVQPLCNPNLLTRRAQRFPRGRHGDGTDISHAGPGGAGRGPEEGKKGAGVDESGGPRGGMGEDEAPAAGMLRGKVEWSGMARVRRLQDGYKENRFFRSVGLPRCKHETTEPRYILPNLRGGRTFDDRSTDDRARARAGLPAARLDDDSEPIAGTANGCRPKH